MAPGSFGMGAANPPHESSRGSSGGVAEVSATGAKGAEGATGRRAELQRLRKERQVCWSLVVLVALLMYSTLAFVKV